MGAAVVVFPGVRAGALCELNTTLSSEGGDVARTLMLVDGA